MAKRMCNCLNVVLNIKEDGCEDVKGADLLGIEEDDSCLHGDCVKVDSFFKGNLILIKLAFAGIEVQQKLLLKERGVGDYEVFRCINCDISTHAVHKFKGLERVVVGKDLLTEVSFDKMRQSKEYSPLFKIILSRSVGEATKRDAERASSVLMSQRSLSESNKKVNDIVKRYLASEEEAMQEKIRIFTEQQKEVFHKIEEKANADKHIFIGLIRKKEENALQFSLSDAMKDAKISTGGSIDSDIEDPSPNLPQIKGRRVRPNRSIPIVASSLPANRNPSRVLSPKIASSLDRGQRTEIKRRPRSQNEDDTLFDLDGFHENKNCEPFFESDDDSSGESSSLDNSGGYLSSNRGNAGDRIYATSVPVKVPMYRPNRRGFFEGKSFEDSEPPPSPDRMAESMKALARSLHDSTSIFGELPGPRYNTMPYQ